MSTQPPQLPLISDTQGTQPETGAQAAAPPDEEDLFGSDIELAEPGSAPAPRAADAAEADLDEEDLFGDADVDDKDLFGSEIGDDNDIDEKALFGDDDDDSSRLHSATPARDQSGTPVGPSGSRTPVGASGGSRTPVGLSGSRTPAQGVPATPGGVPAAPTPSEAPFSEMDEREIFGDMSDDDEPEMVEDVILLRRPAPTRDRPIASLRLPNMLSIEKTAYNPRSISQSMMEGYKEIVDTQGRTVVTLVTPENCIRWRFKKGPDGQILTDEDGRPQYESNGRFVEWEDGSRTLYVGAEAFFISQQDQKICLFEENSQDVHVCHGVVKKRFVATPRSLDTETHDRLKKSQYRKYEPLRRSLLMSAEEQEQSRQFQLMQEEKRQREEAEKKKKPSKAEAPITAAFLEDDGNEGGGGVGPSVKDAKRQRTS